MPTTSSQNEAIGARLRVAREQAGLSQAQVAKLMGLHRPSISEAEAGRRKVSAEELARFAVIFGVDIEWLANNVTQNVEAAKVELAARELAKLKSSDLDRLLKLLATLKLEGDAAE